MPKNKACDIILMLGIKIRKYKKMHCFFSIRWCASCFGGSQIFFTHDCRFFNLSRLKFGHTIDCMGRIGYYSPHMVYGKIRRFYRGLKADE